MSASRRAWRLGCALGKPLGIFGAAWLLVRLHVGRGPDGATVRELLGVAILGGVGLTVSLYVAELSFVDEALQRTATLGVLVGSVLAAIPGSGYFRLSDAVRPQPAR